MSKLLEVKVPDIGDFKNIPVIEVMVKPGDRVKKEDPLVTLESDKATVEVPAPAAGVVRELKIKVGDKVSKDTPLLMLEQSGEADTAPREAAPKPATPPAAPDRISAPRPDQPLAAAA